MQRTKHNAPPRSVLKDLKPEERERRSKGMYDEFLSSNDAGEALTCCRELMVDGYGPKLVRAPTVLNLGLVSI